MVRSARIGCGPDGYLRLMPRAINCGPVERRHERIFNLYDASRSERVSRAASPRLIAPTMRSGMLATSGRKQHRPIHTRLQSSGTRALRLIQPPLTALVVSQLLRNPFRSRCYERLLHDANHKVFDVRALLPSRQS